MKKLLFSLVSVTILLLSSCGSGKWGEIVIDDKNCDNVDIDQIDDFYEIQKGKYHFSYKNEQLCLTLKLRVVENPDKSGLSGYKFDKFTAEMCDVKGHTIKNLNEFVAPDGKLLAEKLLNASVGDIIPVTFVGGNGTKSELKSLAGDIKSLFVDIEYDEMDEDDFSCSASTNSSSISGKMGSADIDKMLDEYEKFVDKYIALMKKAQSGDLSAMSEYASMLESAERLSNKLDNCDGDMTSAQLSRYTRITSKMTSAAM